MIGENKMRSGNRKPQAGAVLDSGAMLYCENHTDERGKGRDQILLTVYHRYSTGEKIEVWFNDCRYVERCFLAIAHAGNRQVILILK